MACVANAAGLRFPGESAIIGGGMDKLKLVLPLIAPFFPFAALIASEAVPATVPFVFEENRGQAEGDARFIARGPGADLLLGRGVRFLTSKSSFELEFAGARGGVKPRGEGRLSARVHYYRGRTHRLENLAAFRTVRYPGLYPGIDLLYYSSGHNSNGRLEYDFELAPGVDYRRIALRFRGARLRLSAEGDLLLETVRGETFRHHRPAAYQMEGDRRVNIAAWFQVEGETARFALAHYDRRKPLVIDPVLGFSATVSDRATTFTADSAGNTYLVREDSGTGDALYIKLDTQGKLVYKTYVGGFSADIPGPLAADSNGNLFVAGSSDSADFPVSSSPCGGVSRDIFLTKLSPSGIILASRCFGGSGNETVSGLALDPTGAPYVAGGTESPDFPTTAGAFQSTKKSPGIVPSGFVAKFDRASLSTAYATFFGSLGKSNIGQLGVDQSGSAIVAGVAEPSGFPVTAGAFMTAPRIDTLLPNDSYGTFAARLSASGSSLVYGTFLPFLTFQGSLSFTPMAMAADAAGNAYFALQEGSTNSLSLLKLNPAGSAATFQKTLPLWLYPASLDIDANGNFLLAGSDTGALPLSADGLQARPGTSLVFKLDSGTGNISYSSIVNAGTPTARFGPQGSILVGGTLTVPFPVTPGASDEANGYGYGILRLIPGNACTPVLDSSFNPVIPAGGGPFTFRVLAPGNCTWVASSSMPNLFSFNSKNYGTGNGALDVFLPDLFGGPGRRIVLSLSPSSQYVLTQGQPLPCAFQSPMGSIFSAPPAGGVVSVPIQTTDGCSFPVSTDTPWIALSGQTSTAANLYLQVASNPGAARTGTVAIGGQNIVINQTQCSYDISTNIPADGMAAVSRVVVNTEAGCPWSATTTAGWIHIGSDGANRNGYGVFTIELEPNTAGDTRSAAIQVGSRTTNVSQNSMGCRISASAASNSLPGTGGATSISVSASSASGKDCTVYANLSPPANLSSPSTVTNQGVFQFTAAANNTGEPIPFRAGISSGNTTIYIPFIQPALNLAPPFNDVTPGNAFFDHITILKNKNVTRGCTFDAQKYCPDRAITRAEMALLLAKAIAAYPWPGLPPYFEDVPPSHPAFIAIQGLRARGITLGCSTIPSKFCPDETLTRGQMAALIVRAKLDSEWFSYASTPYFQDVPANNVFFRHVQKLKDLGITLGCGNGNFCVNAANTRGEMAAFLVRAFYSGF